MNKFNQLLHHLDLVFGFKDKATSTFRKRRQWFDEKRNEHVVLVEYRVRRGAVPKRKKKVRPIDDPTKPIYWLMPGRLNND